MCVQWAQSLGQRHKGWSLKVTYTGFAEAKVRQFIFTSQLANQRAAEPPQPRRSSTRPRGREGGVTPWHPIRGRVVKTWAQGLILPTALTFSQTSQWNKNFIPQ